MGWRSDVESTLELLVDVRGFFDVVRLGLNTRPKLDMDKVRATCGGAKFCRGENKYGRGWSLGLVLEQPTPETFDYLRTVLRCDYGITYVELALDLVTVDRQSARELQSFMEYRFVKPWTRAGGEKFKGTFYSAKRGTPSRYVIYSKRPSKAPGLTSRTPCCHIEWRLTGSHAVRRANIDVLSDLAAFSHRAFWEDKMRLLTVETKTRLGRVYRKGILGKKGPCSARRYQQHAQECLTTYAGINGSATAHELLVANPAFARCMTQIDNTPFLPAE